MCLLINCGNVFLSYHTRWAPCNAFNEMQRTQVKRFNENMSTFVPMIIRGVSGAKIQKKKNSTIKCKTGIKNVKCVMIISVSYVRLWTLEFLQKKSPYFICRYVISFL